MESRSDPVERLMADCLNRPPEDWASAVDRACEEQPELAEELRLRMGLLAQLGQGYSDSPIPDELGDFQLLERIGGGGMGVVYRALQKSLQRDVALKLIRPDLLWFDSTRERFQRETEAIAKLSHPGIVSIHSVGEERGMPFFAMELLGGATLAEVLGRVAGRAPETLTGRDLWEATLIPGDATPDLPEVFRGGWTEACLDLAAQIARALEHASTRGLLHRDVKPSNVMVCPDGRAVLLDFGLTSSAGDEGERMTRTGSAVGTLVYMPVEQLEGRRELDTRADVYALGVTLYELLTLQAPFDGNSEAEIRAAIRSGAPDPVRARNRRVSEEAQVVCLKAMSRAPSDRYPGPRELAADLEAVLARRPIRARRPGPLRRGLRWVQRRPLEATAAGLALATLVGIPSGMLYVEAQNSAAIRTSLEAEQTSRQEAEQARERMAAALEAERRASELAETRRAEADAQRKEAERSRVEAEQARDLAVQAQLTQNDVAQFFVDVIRGSYPGYHEGRTPTVDEMLDFAARNADERLAGRPHSRARIEMMLGIVLNSRPDQDKARQHLTRAVELLEGLEPARSVKDDLAQTLVVSGRSYLHRGKLELAEQQLERALELALEVLEPGDPRIFTHYQELAEMHQYLRRPERCLALRRQALAYAEEYVSDQPVLAAKARAALGFSLWSADQRLEGEALIERSLGELREHAGPADKEYVQALMRAGRVAQSQGHFELATERLTEGAELARALWGEASDAALSAEAAVIDMLLYQHKYEEGIEAYEEWLERATPALHPNNASLASARANYSRALYRTQRFADMIAYHEECDYTVRIRAAFGDQNSATVNATQELADAFAREGQLERCVETLDRLVEILAGSPNGRADRIMQLHMASDIRRRGLGEVEAAREGLEQVLELAGDDLLRLPLGSAGEPVQEAGVRALQDLIELGEQQGWSEEVSSWRAALAARQQRVEESD